MRVVKADAGGRHATAPATRAGATPASRATRDGEARDGDREEGACDRLREEESRKEHAWRIEGGDEPANSSRGSRAGHPRDDGYARGGPAGPGQALDEG